MDSTGIFGLAKCIVDVATDTVEQISPLTSKLGDAVIGKVKEVKKVTVKPTAGEFGVEFERNK